MKAPSKKNNNNSVASEDIFAVILAQHIDMLSCLQDPQRGMPSMLSCDYAQHPLHVRGKHKGVCAKTARCVWSRDHFLAHNKQ